MSFFFSASGSCGVRCQSWAPRCPTAVSVNYMGGGLGGADSSSLDPPRPTLPGRPHPPRLSNAAWGEGVLEVEPLLLHPAYPANLLSHPQVPERRGRDHLHLAPGEQRQAVHADEETDISLHRPDLFEATAVNTRQGGGHEVVHLNAHEVLQL